MAKVWFGRKSLTLDTEKIFMNATTLADCTLNTFRVLTTEDLLPTAVTNLGPIGATPNANAGTISGHTLNFQPASSLFGGVVTTGSQTFAGAKTFNDDVTLASSLLIPTTTTTAGVVFQNSDRFLHSFGGAANSTYCGKESGNFTNTGLYNTGIGESALFSVTTAQQVTSVGSGAGSSLTSGDYNTFLGSNAGGAITVGSNNTLVGRSAGGELVDGTDNIFIGDVAGDGYGASISRTLIIGNDGSDLTAAYIQGIGGVVPAGALDMMVIDPLTYQLGSVPFINETLYSQQFFAPGAFVTSPTVPAALPIAAFSQPSVGGITRVGPGTIHITKKGKYEFYVQLNLDIQCGLYIQMQVDAAQYDANAMCVPGLVGLEVAGFANFVWNQVADAAHDFTFTVAADSFPVPATPPEILAVNVITSYINYPTP